MLMQMNVNLEMQNGLKIVKYSLNHYWKFKSPRSAAAAGLMQFAASFFTSIVNYAVIVQSENVMDLAKDFTALLVISQFDNWFASSSREKIVKDILEDEKESYEELFSVEVTTSVDAGGKNNIPLKEDPIFKEIQKRKDAKYKEAKNRQESCLCLKRGGNDLKRPETIRIAFNKRPDICNMVTYAVYKVLRVVFVSLWFYYFPVFVMIS